MRLSLAKIESSQKYLYLLQFSGFVLERHKCYFLFSHHFYKRSTYKLWSSLRYKLGILRHDLHIFERLQFHIVTCHHHASKTGISKISPVSSFLRHTASRENYIPITYVWCLSPRNNNQCPQPPNLVWSAVTCSWNLICSDNCMPN